ncbi:MAG TPA: ABC transporter substrate-binding protein [Pseudonocardia sp.]|uniref:ABC transporter substrate-binding protein n=1 Tax=Pseudonocardia sp. TaxID=60912 RepID=UPI002C65E400|nr:ABC transporter substrate-binding protein [Pseudonocardia sp.]HTF52966.1 ABC transporter substrate-binding protein [Pseudonocardia sp.]
MSRSRLGVAIIGAGAALLLLATACGGGGGAPQAAGNCTPKHQFSTIEQGTLTVAVHDLPPYSGTTGPDGLSGVDADIVREIAKRECLTITAQAGNTPSLIPSVQQGRADLAIGDWYRTEPRSKVVNLSDPLYLDEMGIISAAGVSTVAELEGKQVGTVDGYLWVKELQQVLGNNLRLYPSSVDMNQDLKAGRIEVGVDSYGSALHTFGGTATKIQVAKPDDRVAASKEAAQSTFPMAKDNQDMLKAVNETIAELHTDGTITKILEANGLPASAEKTGAPRLIP